MKIEKPGVGRPPLGPAMTNNGTDTFVIDLPTPDYVSRLEPTTGSIGFLEPSLNIGSEIIHWSSDLLFYHQ